MSRRDISEQIKNLYNVDISDGLVSKIVEKIAAEITAWQNRPWTVICRIWDKVSITSLTSRYAFQEVMPLRSATAFIKSVLFITFPP